MAKLQAKTTAGFNAVKEEPVIKKMKISDIIIDDEFSSLFKIQDKIKDEIVQSIKDRGYDPDQPVIIWKGKNILVDGHTKRAAAIEAGLEEIYFSEKEFASREDAIFYTFERQVVRRNLTSAEILVAAQMMPDKKAANGEGRAATVMAQRLGISESTMYMAKAVLKDEELAKEVKEDKKSIKKAYKEIKERDKPDVAFHVNDAQGLPENVSFLKAAVILLIESSQKESAEMLINHFLKKNEKRGFYGLLPESISSQLPRLPLVDRSTN